MLDFNDTNTYFLLLIIKLNFINFFCFKCIHHISMKYSLRNSCREFSDESNILLGLPQAMSARQVPKMVCQWLFKTRLLNRNTMDPITHVMWESWQWAITVRNIFSWQSMLFLIAQNTFTFMEYKED